MSGESPQSAWLTTGEKGTSAAIASVLLFADLFGRRATRVPLHVIASYYALHRNVRRGLRPFFTRLHGRTSWSMIRRQVLMFAQCTLDRLFFLRGRHHGFEVTCTGIEHLVKLRRERRGAILLGAHLGSFEAARIIGDEQDFPISILVHFQNARKINAFLRRVNPAFLNRVLEIDPADRSWIFRVQEAIERGTMVAILADRVWAGERSVAARFLGAEAPFPVGPYSLAAVLRCPVYLTFGLYRHPDRYQLFCEPFAELVELPRARRAEAAQVYVQRYADRLEHYCRIAPDNWFNFYDFWQP